MYIVLFVGSVDVYKSHTHVGQYTVLQLGCCYHRIAPQDLHYPLRRQRQMCIRYSTEIFKNPWVS